MPAKISSVDHVRPRDIWPSEPTDFTPWVASEEGLRNINRVTSLNLAVKDGKTEASVGPFSADVLAYVEGSEDRLVVIENQLGPTDHEHLGKLLAYVHGLKAHVGIWIAQEAVTEHRRVLEWLNRTVDSEPTFWLLEVDPIRISNNPEVGVNFRVLVAPERKLEGSIDEVKPWKKDGRSYHHDAETSWPQNIKLLDDLVDKLKGLKDLDIKWQQQMYVKFLFPMTGKELRVYDSLKKDRLDLIFMHAKAADIEGILRAESVSTKIEPSHNYDKDSPWIGYDATISASEGSKLAVAIQNWFERVSNNTSP